jgi:16S rRNA (guanine(966)-N(2))-methyltransferase RsmD
MDSAAKATTANRTRKRTRIEIRIEEKRNMAFLMRVTGGVFRSRALRAPRGTATRPTSDRVREAIFSMLTADGLIHEGARVLDLYAGSGALALEALSRGAGDAVLVEQSRDALTAIRENVQSLDIADRTRIVAGRVERVLSQLDGPFAIVFLDPPYADVRSNTFVRVLDGAAGLLADQGALVLEHATGDVPPPVPRLVLDRTRRYGDTEVSLFRLSTG